MFNKNIKMTRYLLDFILIVCAITLNNQLLNAQEPVCTNFGNIPGPGIIKKSYKTSPFCTN